MRCAVEYVAQGLCLVRGQQHAADHIALTGTPPVREPLEPRFIFGVEPNGDAHAMTVTAVSALAFLRSRRACARMILVMPVVCMLTANPWTGLYDALFAKRNEGTG